MTDKMFLLWLRQRLIYKYGEDENTDFVYKLGNIALKLPDNLCTSNIFRSQE